MYLNIQSILVLSKVINLDQIDKIVKYPIFGVNALNPLNITWFTIIVLLLLKYVISVYPFTNVIKIITKFKQSLLERTISSKQSMIPQKGNRKKSIVRKLFFTPLVISILLSIKVTIDSQNISIILTISAIFTGLMFNLLMLNIDLLNKDSSTPPRNIDIKEKRIQQILSNSYYDICFLIFVSLSLIVISIVILFDLNWPGFLTKMLTTSIIYLLLIFTSTLFMLLSRIFSLLDRK